jgi:hypothetical protein
MISFCFLLTKDLEKEHIWRKWFDNLSQDISFNIVVHTSNNINSEWLKQYILPSEYIRPTRWGYLMEASIQMYKYAFITYNSEWFINLSETHCPFISTKKFIELYNKYISKTIINTFFSSRNPLSHLGVTIKHSQWCIINNSDMKNILDLCASGDEYLLKCISGNVADEHFIGVCLEKTNKLNDCIKLDTCYGDWTRPKNNHWPYTFDASDSNDEVYFRNVLNNNAIMFIRKVVKSFPDEIIYKWIEL